MWYRLIYLWYTWRIHRLEREIAKQQLVMWYYSAEIYILTVRRIKLQYLQQKLRTYDPVAWVEVYCKLYYKKYIEPINLGIIA